MSNNSHPFGMMLNNRNFTAYGEDYRFGFDGMDNTDEVYDDDIAVDFGSRMYDSRLGRWMSVDPSTNKYP